MLDEQPSLGFGSRFSARAAAASSRTNSPSWNVVRLNLPKFVSPLSNCREDNRIISSKNKVSSVMEHDNSWPTTVPSVVLSLPEKATQKHPKWRNCTYNRKTDGRFWIRKSRFLFKFPSNHMSILLSFRHTRTWQTDRSTMRTITIAGPHIVADQLINNQKIRLWSKKI